MPAIEHHNTSSARYNGSRQVHQNKTRFNPARHQPDKALPIEITRKATSLCCRRCQLIIKWKLDYGKYPTVINIRKSVRCCGACNDKCVSIPFHHLCQPCAQELAVCAKCRLSADESELRALDAVRKGNFDQEDAEYYAALGEHPEEGDDDEEEEDEKDDENENVDRIEKTAEQLEKDQERKRKEEELELDHPELIRLRGLDISLLRHEIEDARKNLALSKIKAGGKLKERDRRTAIRMLQKGDERAAVEIAEKRAKRDHDDDDEDQDEEEEEDDEDEEEVSVKKMTKDSKINLQKMMTKNEAVEAPKAELKLAQAAKKAGDTESDEETL